MHNSVRQRFLTGAIWSVVGSAGARITVLLATILAGRFLGAHAYGQLGIIQSTVALFGTLAGAGLGLTATKHVAEHRLRDADRAGRYIGLVLLTTTIAGAVMGLALALTAGYVAPHILDAPDLVVAVRVASGLVFLGAVIGAQSGAILGLEEYRAHALTTCLRGVGGGVFLVGGMLLWGLNGGVVGLVAGEAVTALAGMVILRRACRRQNIRPQYRNLEAEVPALWRFSVPALLGSVVIMPALLGSNLLLARSAGGYAALGVFTAALKWNALVLFVPAALSLPQLPLLSNLHGMGQVRQFQKAFRAYLVVCAAVMVIPMIVLILGASWVMGLHGPQFTGGALVLAIMAAAAIPMGLNNIIGQAVVSTNGIWWRMAADVGLAGALAVAAVGLVPRYGAVGLAAAYFIAFSVATIGLMILLRVRGGSAAQTVRAAELSNAGVSI